MASLTVPVTKSNYNFLCVYHPYPFKFTNRDTLALALGAIIKYQARSYALIDEAIVRADFPKEIEINFSKFYKKRNTKISSRCVRAVNCKIERIIQSELNAFIRVCMTIDANVEIRSKIYEFLQKYGLSDDAKYVSTLERQNRRYRTLIGELKK